MIDQIFQAVTLSGVSSYLGPEWLDVEDAPPALIWVPTEADFTPGQRKANTTDIARQSLGTASVTTRVRVWAVGTITGEEDQSQADYREVWDLLRRFLVAVYDAAVGSCRVGRMTWLTEAGQALVEHGKAVDVDVEWDIPVTRDPATTVRITDETPPPDGQVNLVTIGAVGPEIIE